MPCPGSRGVKGVVGRKSDGPRETNTFLIVSRMDMLRREDTSSCPTTPINLEVSTSVNGHTLEDNIE
jgi:hypothetical protein